MGFFDKIKEIVTESDDDEYDDFYEDNKGGSVGIAPPIRDRFSRRESSSNEREERYSERPRIKRHDSDKVVNIHTTTQLQVVLVKPEKFDEAAAIADNLNEKRTVVLNLESTNRDVARRLLDFLSGVAYASNGQINCGLHRRLHLALRREEGRHLRPCAGPDQGFPPVRIMDF